jgi:hypothetical protein
MIVDDHRTVGIAQCTQCSTVYEATGWAPRHCDHCDRDWGESMFDPCLGRIKGADAACCGHGDPGAAYIARRD